ncbi:MAG: SPOR domain-containing protein, partial [Hyphococcus sp.]
TSAERDGQRLIGVVLGGRSSRTRDKHMRDILSQGFAAIQRKPALIAALHRKKPAPRLKPTLVAALEAEKAAPTIAGNEPLRQEIITAAAMLPDSEEATGLEMSPDLLGELIAAADTDDFNEFQRVKMASLDAASGFIGEGDRQALNEFAWGVQIGAYSSKPLAQKELEEAAYKGGLMDRERNVTPMTQDDGGTLFRARITKLSEIEAATACEVLKDDGLQCFVVSAEQ